MIRLDYLAGAILMLASGFITGASVGYTIVATLLVGIMLFVIEVLYGFWRKP